MADQNDWLDVAIIGGGVSGVYAGWRLLTAGEPRPADVTVFEADDHIGGRLLSVPAPGIPNMVAELGGMRILPAVQPRIQRLLDVLKDEGRDIETYPFPVDQPENIAYLRGTHLRLSDFGQATAPAPGAPVAPRTPVPYRLRFLEQGKTAGQIITNAIEQIVPGITAEGLSEYQRREMAHRASFDGKPLWEQGFWNVLMRVISGEAYMLGIDAGGYQTTLMNWNAADAIPWYLSDFGVDPRYLGFKRGFQQVPLTLGELFEQAGGNVELNTKVAGFGLVDGGVEVRFAGKRAPVRARRLVLGLPRRALDLIAPESPFLERDDVRPLVHAVTPRPLFKLFTTYAYPWWCPAGVKAGRTTTDLPVRQTYYWPTDQGTPCTSGPAMLMASYDDGTNIGFWDGFRPKRGRGWRAEAEDAAPPARFENQDTVDPEWEENAAPAAMVAEVQRQLAVVHGVSFTPEVRNAAFRDWGDDPFGGGWNSWNIGVQSDQVQKGIAQPDPRVPVYICGEAYSDAQGWVEGALQSTDRVLQKLGVPPLVAEGL